MLPTRLKPYSHHRHTDDVRAPDHGATLMADGTDPNRFQSGFAVDSGQPGTPKSLRTPLTAAESYFRADFRFAARLAAR